MGRAGTLPQTRSPPLRTSSRNGLQGALVHTRHKHITSQSPTSSRACHTRRQTTVTSIHVTEEREKQYAVHVYPWPCSIYEPLHALESIHILLVAMWPIEPVVDIWLPRAASLHVQPLCFDRPLLGSSLWRRTALAQCSAEAATTAAVDRATAAGGGGALALPASHWLAARRLARAQRRRLRLAALLAG